MSLDGDDFRRLRQAEADPRFNPKLPLPSAPTLRYAGRVGVPGPGEKVCPRCKGHGQRRNEVGPFNGCARCDATGVIPA